jgi:hypothetical protein
MSMNSQYSRVAICLCHGFTSLLSFILCRCGLMLQLYGLNLDIHLNIGLCIHKVMGKENIVWFVIHSNLRDVIIAQNVTDVY